MKYIRTKLPAKYLPVIIVFSILAISCDMLPFDTGVCTTEFVILGVTVLDKNEEPVVFNQVRVTDVRTGEVIDLCEENNCTDRQIAGHPDTGWYAIFHDGLIDKLSFYSMPVLFEGRNDSLSVEQVFLINEDGCHVGKKAGPNVIIIDD